MINLKPYQKYKDSGVECIGKIPEHWEVKRLKFVARLAYGKSLPDEKREDGDYLVFGSNGLVGSHSSAVTCGPSIVIGRKGSFGKVVYVDTPCYPIDTAYFIDEGYTKSDLKWLYYLMQTLELDKFSMDSAVPGLNRESTHNKLIPYFNITEQVQIAKFLDRQTSQIENLIEKYERLIDLLKEKKTTLISRVVTKGLNSNVKMKDLGVEWIGKIPEHWEAKKLKFVSKIIMGQSPDSKYYNFDGEGYPFLQGNAEFTELYPKAVKYCTQANKFSQKGDILISVRAPVGEINISDQKYGIGRGLVAIRPKLKQILPSYVWYGLNVFKISFNLLVSGSTYEAISVDDVKNMLVSLPTKDEQQQITDYLDKETSNIDALVGKINKQIELLKEHKASLISHIVTGKVNVRGKIA